MNFVMGMVLTLLCDGNKLKWAAGAELYSFALGSQCREALQQIYSSNTGLFCDDSNMQSLNVGYITSFGLASDCKAAIVQARDHKGYFCQKSILTDRFGNQIHDYVWKHKCVEALATI